MLQEPEDFEIPAPPKILQPRSPVSPVALLTQVGDVEAQVLAVQHEVSIEAWTFEKSSQGSEPLWCNRQAVELVLSVLALCCWAAMCVLDLSGYWPDLESASLPSQILSVAVLAVSCTALAIRQCCACRSQDPQSSRSSDLLFDAVRLPALQYRLLVVLASQWCLLCGAAAWLVLNASNQRRAQVIAGLLALLALLSLLLCSLVFVFSQHKQKLKVSDLRAPPKEKQSADDDDSRNTQIRSSGASLEALDLDSMTSCAGLSRTNTPKSLQQLQAQLEVEEAALADLADMAGTNSVSADSEFSDNFVGNILTGQSDRSGALRCVKVAPLDSLDGGCKQVVFKQVPLRSSEGRWRLLFPTCASAVLGASPTDTLTMSVGVDALGHRKSGTTRFRFETDEEVEKSLEKEIDRHHLEVEQDARFSRSASPSSSLCSQSPGAQVRGCPSSSSGLSDVSGKSETSSFGD